MKAIWSCAVAGFLLSFPSSGGTAPGDAPPSASNLSSFKGIYKGRVNYGGVVSGPTNARFTAVSSAERGRLRLSSRLSFGGMSAFLLESIRFDDNRAFYSIQLVGPSNDAGFGTGTASINRNVIRYNATFSISGTPFFIQGTITRRKSGKLTVNETLFGPATIPIRYTLNPQG